MKCGKILYGAACFMLGAAVFGGGVAYAAGVLAEKSPCVVYVDGKLTELDAYLIDGSNYVKLRDIGKATDSFNVYWDGTVQIESGKHYTGEAPASAPAPQTPTEVNTDASADANPAIFTGNYTREAYNAIRQTVTTGADSALVAMSDGTWDAMQEVIAAIGEWPAYHLKAKDGKAYFKSQYSDTYQAAADYCKPFIDSLAGKSDTDKAKTIAFYVCDRLTYATNAFSGPNTVLTSDAVSKGNCMAYAHNFMFLCNMADIPCVFVHSADHQWNEVYVGGEWRSVDLTGTDVGYDSAKPERATVFFTKQDMQGASYQQAQPMLTMIAKEVLVPGSTK